MLTSNASYFAVASRTEQLGSARSPRAEDHEKWWERFALRCSGSDCRHRGKLWSLHLRKSSGVLFDGRWYCEMECLKPTLTFRIHNLLSSFVAEKPRTYRLPLGLLLVDRGLVSAPQLREVLRLQRESGSGRIGEWFCKLGFVTEPQLTAALAQQWGCPVFPLDRIALAPAINGLVPIPLLESARAVPAYASQDGTVIHLAFSERLDHTTLYGIEQMLGCRTFPCVASDLALSNLLEHLRRVSPPNETSFDTIRDPIEMTWAISNYAVELMAQRFAVVRAGAYIWVRFFRGRTTRDLLFRILPEPAPSNSERATSSAKVFSLSADEERVSVSNATPSL